MANNLGVTTGVDANIKTTDTAGVHVPHHNVDTLPAIPAGTNAIGKLAANSGVDIGDVDVLTVGGQTPSYGSGAIDAGTIRTAAATNSPGVTAPGQATMAASLPVTIASDQYTAHDAADAGNPIKVGFKAQSGLSAVTLVAANDRTNAYAGLDGSLYVRTVPLPDIVSGNASNTDGTSTSVIATAGAGIKQYLTQVVLTNMHATATVYVEMKSGTTVKATIPCPPGGATISFDPPLPPNAANEAWNFDPSAATTTIYCTAVGFKSKI